MVPLPTLMPWRSRCSSPSPEARASSQTPIFALYGGFLTLGWVCMGRAPTTRAHVVHPVDGMALIPVSMTGQARDHLAAALDDFPGSRAFI